MVHRAREYLKKLPSVVLKNGATLPEARKLARHSDIKMTMKYTHIGIDDQAKALENLPALQMRCISGNTDGQKVSPDDSGEPVGNEKNPVASRGSDVCCHPLSVGNRVEAAGIEPASRDISMQASTCVVGYLIVGISIANQQAFDHPIRELCFALSVLDVTQD